MKGFRDLLMNIIFVDGLLFLSENKDNILVATIISSVVNCIYILTRFNKIKYYLSTAVLQLPIIILFVFYTDSYRVWKIILLSVWICLQMYQCIYYYYYNVGYADSELLRNDNVDVADAYDNQHAQIAVIIESPLLENPPLSTVYIINHVCAKDETKDETKDEICTEDCSICLEQLKSYIKLPCSHKIHKTCLLGLLNRNILLCPLCKARIEL
jgi:hypothetical protein